jgi:hypothetical protein
MSDLVETFRAMDDVRKLLRAELGMPCPVCQRLLPKAHPKILLPGGFCRMHRYTDPRPDSLIDEFHARLSATQEPTA